jgi:hypothetical protein
LYAVVDGILRHNLEIQPGFVRHRSDELMASLFHRVMFVVLAAGAAATVTAQSTDTGILSNQDLANARAMIREGQETVIREELKLTAEEEAAFWPLYAEYRADMLPIQDRYVTLIFGYMRQYESGVLTDNYAEEMLEGYFSVKNDLLRTRKKYIRQFRKTLPMLKVARFYQLENKMNADIDAELALLVPLVEAN